MHTAVMRNRVVIGKHNVTITARPRILFPVNSNRSDRIITRGFGLGEIPLLRDVKEFTAAYMTPGTRQHKEMEQATTQRDRRVIASLRLLQYAHAKAPDAARELVEAFSVLSGGWRPRDLGYGHLSQRELAANFYSGSFNDEMKSARVIMSRPTRSEAPVPAIWAPDIRTAAFVFAAFRGVEVCASCHRLFAPDRERGEKYCSDACGQNFRQKLYRQRVKSQTRKGNR
jgi:hypothetical protein